VNDEAVHRIPLRHGISHEDVAKSYLGLMCLGKSDFEAVANLREEDLRAFTNPLGGALCGTWVMNRDEFPEAGQVEKRFWEPLQFQAVGTGHWPSLSVPHDSSHASATWVQPASRGLSQG
jgi:hypothetical protein